MKKCKGCGRNKKLIDFWKQSTGKFGVRSKCKKCLSREMEKWRNDNKDSLNKYVRKWNQNNPKNKQKINERWRAKNPYYLRSWRTKNKTNTHYKIANNLRVRLRMALHGNYKSGSAVRDLGCSIDEFKQFLESQFKLGMSWENYGVNGWHIDHIKALSNFDLTKREEILEACHYTNLQPLWAKENRSKSNK
jgi:hypothetical protein